MLLKNRITRLEKGSAANGSFPKLLFRTFFSPGEEHGDTRYAHIIGKGLKLNREHEESEAEFIQRAYIDCVTAYGLDQVNPCTLNDSDLAMIAATASPKLALKHMKGDGLTDDDLSTVAESM